MAELGYLEILKTLNVDNASIVHDKDAIFSHFHFDSRMIEHDNSIFFALQGENGHGIEHADKLEKFKNILIISDKNVNYKGKLPVIKVDDPLKSAQFLSSYLRDSLVYTTFIGVTGSAGKTTTKEFVGQILSFKEKTYTSYKNWNNWLGLPFSLLATDDKARFAVFELAMSNKEKEISLLTTILKPKIAVILNTYPVHTEFFKDVTKIAEGKSEILKELRGDGVGIISGDIKELRDAVQKYKGEKIFFGLGKSNDIVLKSVESIGSKTRLTVNFFGIDEKFDTNLFYRAHILNLFAAIVIARYCGLSIQEINCAVQNMKISAKRGEIEEFKGITIINDTYNSNPQALNISASWVCDFYKKERKVAVIGDMYELGDEAEKYHVECGKILSGLGFDKLIFVGQYAPFYKEGALNKGFKEEKMFICENANEAGLKISSICKESDILFLKGSRAVMLEKAIEVFKNELS